MKTCPFNINHQDCTKMDVYGTEFMHFLINKKIKE